MADALKETHERIGRQVAEAIATLFAVLSQQLAVQAPSPSAEVEALRAEVAALQARLERLEGASTRRTTVTRTASPEPAAAGGAGEPSARGGRRGATQAARRGRRPAAGATRKGPRRRRTPKAEVRERALEAGRSLAARGETVNLKTVADAAGLNYGQVTYAFRRKENLLKELGLLQEGQDGQVR